MELLALRLASVVAVALIYMLFDLLNKRNVPGIFVYSTMAYGLMLTVLYLDVPAIAYSAAVAAVIFSMGYFAYKIGYLGFGDVAEFTAITLILPFQGLPLLANLFQYSIPFIASVLIASGIAALVLVPIFYIPRARKALKKRLTSMVSKKDQLKSVLIGAAYAAFMGILSITGLITFYGIAIMALLTFGSVFTVLFERPITASMVSYLSADRLEEEDMLALSMLSAEAKAQLRRKVKSFGQLVTRDMMREIKAKQIKAKLPVYRQGIPFALPIFIGTVATVLLGNPLLLAIH